MPVSADTLRLHLDYSEWASRRLLDAAAAIPAEHLTRDFKTSDGTVVNTLAHIFAAERSWLARVQGSPPAVFISPEDRDLATLQKSWPALFDRWKQWAAPMTDQQALADISYRDLSGNSWTTPLWQILLHVVNHGTHHRGAVSGFLRAMGHQPPALDLIAYYRSL